MKDEISVGPRGIPVWSTQVEAIRAVVGQYLHDEKRHWLESGKPNDHIFCSLANLDRWLYLISPEGQSSEAEVWLRAAAARNHSLERKASE